LALRSSVSLEPFVTGQATHSLIDLAFGLVDDLARCLPPLVHDTPFLLLPPNLLDLTDFFLNFAGYIFNGTFIFQIWIIA
jgi:hypothetical protein